MRSLFAIKESRLFVKAVNLLPRLKHHVNRAIKAAFQILGFGIYRKEPPFNNTQIQNNEGSAYQKVRPFATYSPWLSDADFLDIYGKIRNHTLVDVYRCYELWTCAKQISNVDGNILEVGVWRGGTGILLAEAMRNSKTKTVYLADTFAGVVKAGEEDKSYRGGEHSDTSLDIVQTLLDKLSVKNAEILRGIFPEETGGRIRGRIALLHCDVDVYLSTKHIVEWCLPRLSIVAMMVFDDYGFAGCEGVTKFCNELKNAKGFRFIHNLNGHAIFIKVGE